MLSSPKAWGLYSTSLLSLRYVQLFWSCGITLPLLFLLLNGLLLLSFIISYVMVDVAVVQGKYWVAEWQSWICLVIYVVSYLNRFVFSVMSHMVVVRGKCWAVELWMATMIRLGNMCHIVFKWVRVRSTSICTQPVY